MGEFDAAAHGVDALGADTDSVAEMPGKFFGFSAVAAATVGGFYFAAALARAVCIRRFLSMSEGTASGAR